MESVVSRIPPANVVHSCTRPFFRGHARWVCRRHQQARGFSPNRSKTFTSSPSPQLVPLHRSCNPCGREPPSLCVPPTKNETMSPGSTTERVKWGLSFSPGEDLALARSFASTTLSTTDMTSDLYWEAVADIYKNQVETRIPRTAKSLLNRSTTLQRVVQ